MKTAFFANLEQRKIFDQEEVSKKCIFGAKIQILHFSNYLYFFSAKRATLSLFWRENCYFLSIKSNLDLGAKIVTFQIICDFTRF